MSASTERTLSLTFLAIALAGLVLGLVALGVWGLPALLLTLAGTALSLTIVAMWGSLQEMGESDEMTFEQALSYAAPTAAEEQKHALLRTLNDLKYELSVGKISQEDYDEVSAEIREKAKRVIALTDDSMKERLAAAQKRLELHAAERSAEVAKKVKGKKKHVVKNESEGASSEAREDSKRVNAEQHVADDSATSDSAERGEEIRS